MGVEPTNPRPIMGIEGYTGMGMEQSGDNKKLPDAFKALSGKQREFIANIPKKETLVFEKSDVRKLEKITATLQKGSKRSKTRLGKISLAINNFIVKLFSKNKLGRAKLTEAVKTFDDKIAAKKKDIKEGFPIEIDLNEGDDKSDEVWF